MNARALMELIVMKVGLDIGVIGSEIFTMLMVMAIVTNLMTTPMLIAFTRGTAVSLATTNATSSSGNAP